MHILSPETDNCPSWISGRERMSVENISWSISTKECCWPRRGSKLLLDLGLHCLLRHSWLSKYCILGKPGKPYLIKNTLPQKTFASVSTPNSSFQWLMFFMPIIYTKLWCTCFREVKSIYAQDAIKRGLEVDSQFIAIYKMLIALFFFFFFFFE